MDSQSISSLIESQSTQDIHTALDLISKSQTEDSIQLLRNNIYRLLEHPDNRIQEQTNAILIGYITKADVELQINTIERLLDLLYLSPVFYQYRNPVALVKQILNGPIPDQNNKIKVIQPMSMNKYFIQTKNDGLLQGVLQLFNHLLSCIQILKLVNLCIRTHVSEIIEVIFRSCMHTNKYVRIWALKFIVHLQNEAKYERLLQNTIFAGLQDESVEVRMETLKYLNTHKIANPETIGVPLLLTCHFENLSDIAANLSKELFPSDQAGPPILGLITRLCANNKQGLLDECYIASVSRYYQLRASGLSTIQSIMLFLKNSEDGIPYDNIMKISQNCAFYETDPQVRGVALTLQYHLVRLHKDKMQAVNLIWQNALFHLSDVPEDCKLNSARILAIFYESCRNEIEQKIQLLKDRNAIYNDYLGITSEQLSEEQKTMIDQSVQAQGGRERVINKHLIQTLLGLGLLFRYISTTLMTQDLPQYLEYLLQSLVYHLRHQLLFKDGLEQYKLLTYDAIIDGLVDLKQYKRLPIKLIDASELLSCLKNDQMNNHINRLEDLVGKTIIQGRL